MKKIAVIGSGISGIASAYYLTKYGHDVTLFEAGSYFGGHTNTIDIDYDDKKIPVDTGFLVHNDKTYPNLIDFFDELGVDVYPSDMSFSVQKVEDNIMWAGTNLFTVFAQVKNLFSPRFYRFIYSVLKFNRNSSRYLSEAKKNTSMTLGEMLDIYGYSEDFRRWYLLPMGGCIWSTPTDKMLEFPAFTFIQFCINHGLLQITKRPQWKTVVSGCRTYVSKALYYVDRKYLDEEVKHVETIADGVLVRTSKREKVFDSCFLCNHPPETLTYLKTDKTTMNYLEKFKYQKNIAVVHSDVNVLPIKKAWSSWNYTSVNNLDGSDSVSVSYLINMLQPLPTKKPVVVTLNPVTPIDPNKVFKKIDYKHPLFDDGAIKAQTSIQNIQGQGNIYFAGAWLRYGFHEDGILSSKIAIDKFFKKIGQVEESFVIL